MELGKLATKQEKYAYYRIMEFRFLLSKQDEFKGNQENEKNTSSCEKVWEKCKRLGVGVTEMLSRESRSFLV